MGHLSSYPINYGTKNGVRTKIRCLEKTGKFIVAKKGIKNLNFTTRLKFLLLLIQEKGRRTQIHISAKVKKKVKTTGGRIGNEIWQTYQWQFC